MIKHVSKDSKHLIKLAIRNINNVLGGSEQFDEDLLDDQIHFLLLLDFILQPLNLLLMANMGLLDEIIGSSNQVIINLDHYGDGVEIMLN